MVRRTFYGGGAAVMVQEGEECGRCGEFGSRGEIKKYISSPLRLQDDPFYYG
ncbi:MAG: hypothetical protein WBA93_11670 [Microcoleaceae cyanobacterium]